MSVECCTSTSQSTEAFWSRVECYPVRLAQSETSPLLEMAHDFFSNRTLSKAHKEEDDPERLEHLLDRGEQNLRFVLRKYRMAEPRPPEPPATATGTTKKMRRRRGAATSRTTETGNGDMERLGGSNSGDGAWTPGR